MTNKDAQATMTNKIYVWDFLVRFFHWTLVLGFTIAYFTGDDLELVHAYVGYYIIGLILIRIIWGFVGSRYARFSQFITSPLQAITYIKHLFSGDSPQAGEKKYIGHNPAGGWMTIMLLVSILFTSYSGLVVYGIEGDGPLASTYASPTLSLVQQTEEHDDDNNKYESENEQAEEFWEEIHEFSANFTVLLIFLHIAGVLLSSRKSHQNLAKSMLTGYKQDPDK